MLRGKLCETGKLSRNSVHSLVKLNVSTKRSALARYGVGSSERKIDFFACQAKDRHHSPLYSLYMYYVEPSETRKDNSSICCSFPFSFSTDIAADLPLNYEFLWPRVLQREQDVWANQDR